MPLIPAPYVRQDYRGLNDAEDTLLRRYLQSLDEEIVGLETAVELGPGESLPEFRDDALRRSWQRSSKYKADAVVETSGLLRIVELKDFIRTSSLGQLLSYRFWYDIERSPDKPVQLVATAPDINPSAVQPHRFHGVSLHLQTLEGQAHLAQGEEAQPPFTPP
jgi:hypothetical protein